MLSNKFVRFFLLSASLVLSAIGHSQVANTGPVFVGGGVGSATTSSGVVSISTTGGGAMGAGVVGKPFCADIETQRTQVLADGNQIHNTGHEHICRDSQGRVRREIQPLVINAMGADPPVPPIINITDPVANTRYTLLANQHKAIKHEFRISRPALTTATARPLPQSVSPRSSKDVSVEQLGTEAMNGLVAKGTRITRTIPAGVAGNQQPLTITSENWFSEDLGETVLNKQSDPRSGETIREMKNISREEPDPTLFQVPTDYSVEEAPLPQPR